MPTGWNVWADWTRLDHCERMLHVGGGTLRLCTGTLLWTVETPMANSSMTLAWGPICLHTYIGLHGPYMVPTAACIHSVYEEEEGLYVGCRRKVHSHEPNLHQQNMIG